mgnify:CR=1 FL=1
MVSVEEPSQVLVELLKHFQEDVEAAIETLEILQDKELLESIRRGLKDFEEGRVLSFEELKAKYGL